MYGAVAGLGTVFRVAKLGQTGLLEGCHVGPTGQAARRRRAADGSFMGHQFFKKLLFKYTGGFFCVLFKFLAFVRFSAQGYDSAPPSALTQVSQTHLQLTQINKKTRKSQFHQ